MSALFLDRWFAFGPDILAMLLDMGLFPPRPSAETG